MGEWARRGRCGCADKDAEIERLRAEVDAWRSRDGRQVDNLRQALDDLERWQAKTARLQALIDAWADSHHQALVLDPPDAAVQAWMRHTVNSSRLLKAATPQREQTDGAR